jgi:hypothetical protein
MMSDWHEYIPQECMGNHDFIPRIATFSNGSKHVQKQCVLCGETDKTYIKKSTFSADAFAMLRPIDVEKKEELLNRRSDFSREQVELRREKWWDNYHEYLASVEWAKIRAKVFRRAGGVCECCCDATARHCHHVTYDRLGNELLEDLLAVCIPCHEEIHGRKLT